MAQSAIPHRFAWGTVLFWCSLWLQAEPRIIQVVPSSIPYGHAADIIVTVTDASPATHLTLLPGGTALGTPIALKNALFLTRLNSDASSASGNSNHHPDSILAATPHELVIINTATPAPVIKTLLTWAQPVTHLAAKGTFVVVADKSQWVRVYDLRDTGPIRLHQRFRVSAPVRDVTVDNFMAFILLDNGWVFGADLSSPVTSLKKLVKLPDNTQRLVTQHGHCYSASITTGLSIANCDAKTWHERSHFATSGVIHDILVDGDVVYLADGLSGVTLIDARDTAHPKLLGSNNKLGDVRRLTLGTGILASKLGDVKRLALGAGRVLASNTHGNLLLLDTTRPELPLLISSFPAHTLHPKALLWHDGSAWLANSTEIQQVDFSAEAAPLLSDEGVNLGGSRRGWVQDSILYVADWFSGLHLYDISNPKRLRHVGNFHTPGSSKGVVVRDHIAYVADDDHGVAILDVNNPQQPILLSTLPTTGLAYTMKLVEQRLYIADHRGGLHIADISDVRKPKILGSYDTPGKSWAVEVHDHFAFVADDATGLLIFDVADAQQPRLVSQFTPGGAVEDVRLRNGYAFVTFFDQGLYILDINDPTLPRVVSHTAIPGNARGVELQGRYAYIAAWEAGLQVVDVHDPAHPQLVGYFDTDGSAWGVTVSGKHAYVLDWWGGVKSIDIRTPARPQLADRYHARNVIQGVTLTGRYALTAAGDAGLQIFDIKNPLNPVWVTGVEILTATSTSSASSASSANSVAVLDSTAYVATASGIALVELHDPFSARLLRIIPSPAPLRLIRSANNALVTLDTTGTVYAVTPDKDALLPIATAVQDIWLEGEQLYLARGRAGISRLDMKHTQTLNLQTDSAARFIRTYQDTLVAVLDTNQLAVFNISDTQLLQVSTLTLGAPILDLQITGNELFVTLLGNEFLLIDLDNKQQPRLRLRTRSTHTLTRLVARDAQIFFAGDFKLSSLKLPPRIAFTRVAPETFSATLPADLPLGSYDISGTFSLPNAVRVTLKTGKKPRITPEQFQQLLREQQRAQQK